MASVVPEALDQPTRSGENSRIPTKSASDIAGYQRPFDTRLLPKTARVFFQVGEFVGWIIEASEA